MKAKSIIHPKSRDSGNQKGHKAQKSWQVFRDTKPAPLNWTPPPAKHV